MWRTRQESKKELDELYEKYGGRQLKQIESEQAKWMARIEEHLDAGLWQLLEVTVTDNTSRKSTTLTVPATVFDDCYICTTPVVKTPAVTSVELIFKTGEYYLCLEVADEVPSATHDVTIVRKGWGFLAAPWTAKTKLLKRVVDTLDPVVTL